MLAALKIAIGKQLVKLIPWLIERLITWSTEFVTEYLKKKEEERRARDVDQSETEDEFDRATDRMP